MPIECVFILKELGETFRLGQLSLSILPTVDDIVILDNEEFRVLERKFNFSETDSRRHYVTFFLKRGDKL